VHWESFLDQCLEGLTEEVFLKGPAIIVRVCSTAPFWNKSCKKIERFNPPLLDCLLELFGG